MVTACPDDDLLRSLLLGLVWGPQAEELEGHLEVCERCASRGDELPARDKVLEALAGKPPGPLVPPEDAAVVAAAVARLERLPLDDGTGGAEGDTPSEGGPAGSMPAFERLGPYVVVRLIGAGGMGVVYEAEDPVLGRRLALKVMRPEQAALPGGRGRFVREAQLAAVLHHDNLVPIWHIGEDAGVPFLAMPLLAGETLADYLRREPRPPLALTLQVATEVAAGLGAAHARGLVHRDIKPGNIWLESLPPEAGGGAPRRRARILDFGLARPAGEGKAGLSQYGAVLGTPEYASPEQARGQAVDARTDLFSLGCVLYEMAAGRRPFESGDALGVLMAVVSEDPPAPHEVDLSVPRALSDLIVSLLAKDPGQRPPDAAAVARALQGIRKGHAEAGGAARRRRPRVAWTLALLAAGLAATAAVVVWIVTKSGPVKMETTDPDIEVTARSGGIVRIRDRKSGQVWNLDPEKFTLQQAEKPDGLTIELPGREPIVLKRQGKAVLRVEYAGDAVHEVREGWVWSRAGRGAWLRGVRIKQTVKGPCARKGLETPFHLAEDGRLGRTTAGGFLWEERPLRFTKLGVGEEARGRKVTLARDTKGGVCVWGGGIEEHLRDLVVGGDVDLGRCWVAVDRSIVSRRADGSWWRYDANGKHALTGARRLPDGKCWLLDYREDGKKRICDADGLAERKLDAELGDKSVLVQKRDGRYWLYKGDRRYPIIDAKQLPDKRSWVLTEVQGNFVYDADGGSGANAGIEVGDGSALYQKWNRWWRYAPDGRHEVPELAGVDLESRDQPGPGGGRVNMFKNGRVLYGAKGVPLKWFASKAEYEKWAAAEKGR